MSSANPSKGVYPVPARTMTIAMWLFLAALAMLFISSMMGYVAIRTGFFGPEGLKLPPLGTLHLPWMLWISTAVILLASFTVHCAVGAVRREKQSLLRGYLVATLCLSVAFVLVQTPALWSMLAEHRALLDTTDGTRLYGLIFFFVLVHALHVIGGLIFLMMVLLKAYAGKYDHEHYIGVRHAALYWHFLDVVWLFMFGIMIGLR
jgi:heme/copper-type cytochrome/quinol oxidase subunit 3